MHVAGHGGGHTPGCTDPFGRTHFPSGCRESLLYKGPVRGDGTSPYPSTTARGDPQTGNYRPQPVVSTEFCDDVATSRVSSRERGPVRGTGPPALKDGRAPGLRGTGTVVRAVVRPAAAAATLGRHLSRGGRRACTGPHFILTLTSGPSLI